MLEWRYGDQLNWRLVVVGLSEDTSRYERLGYTPVRSALGQVRFRDDYGMPFATVPKSGLSPSSPACRAIVAARLQSPGSEWRVFRVLQLANFTTPFLFKDVDAMRSVLRDVRGIDADAVVDAIDSPEVLEAYERDKAETRTAAGSPTERQGKASSSDGKVRYTAPSVVFSTDDGRRLEAGGFQPVEAYDVLIVNLDPTIERREAPETPAPLLDAFPDGLTTQEVAALMTPNNGFADRAGAERSLLGLVGEGSALRQPIGDDALWRSAAVLSAAA